MSPEISERPFGVPVSFSETAYDGLPSPSNLHGKRHITRRTWKSVVQKLTTSECAGNFTALRVALRPICSSHMI
jgi:hypothetical protein